MRVNSWLMASIVAVCLTAAARSQEIDWQKFDEAFGRKAAVSGDVHRYGLSRSDLSVTLDGVTIKPAHGGVMAMGDLVLLETEVDPVRM